jgi:hypothetical protein
MGNKYYNFESYKKKIFHILCESSSLLMIKYFIIALWKPYWNFKCQESLLLSSLYEQVVHRHFYQTII